MRIILAALLMTLTASLASRTLAESTTIICLLDGSGTFTRGDDNRPLKIEQTITFSDNYVDNWSHRFITDYDYQEPWVLAGGNKYGWLSFDKSVTEETIMISSKIDRSKTMRALQSNVTNSYYQINISVSRRTGVSVVRSTYSWAMDHGEGTEQFSYDYEYHVSGKCEAAVNKF